MIFSPQVHNTQGGAAASEADFCCSKSISIPSPSKMLPSTCSRFCFNTNLFHFLLVAFFILPILNLIHKDYKAYLSLGPGGTPSTFSGYLRIKFLSLFVLSDPTVPGTIHPHLKPGLLKPIDIPHRETVRPTVAGIAPHRQTTQKATQELFTLLSNALSCLAQTPPNTSLLRPGTSCFEKHGTGLFSLSPIVRTCNGEICHVHPSDGSMHLVLHPADAKLVLEGGWGERHPLARGGWFRRFVPREFVMVYAPKQEKDVEVLVRIVCAAAWWVGGVEVGEKGAKMNASLRGDAGQTMAMDGASAVNEGGGGPVTCQRCMGRLRDYDLSEI